MAPIADKMSIIIAQSGKLSKTSQMLGVAATAAIIYLLRKLREVRDKTPPGSFGLPLLGETLGFVTNVTTWVAKRKAKYGPIFKTHILFSPAVYVDGEHAKILFKDNAVGWPAPWEELLGPGALTVANGAHHKFLRSVSATAFSQSALASYLPEIQDLTMKHLSSWAHSSEGVRDIEPEIQLYTFQIVVKLLLGVNTDGKDLKSVLTPFTTFVDAFTGLVPLNVWWTAHGKGMRARAELLKYFQGVIDKKRANPSPDASDMLTNLMNARENGQAMSDDELADQCLNMMFAGHDTTKVTIQSMLHYLQRHPDIEKEMMDEVSQIWDGSSPITMEMTAKIRKGKCGRFLDEVLRLKPAVPATYRAVPEDIHYQGFVIPKGWKLVTSPICNHEHISSNMADIDMSIDHSKLREDQYNPFGGGAQVHWLQLY